MPICRIINGVIVPPTHLELIVADHCNLSCSLCNHASPLVFPWLADPETIRRDLSILTQHYRPRLVKVLGGEPLLHPDLAEVITAARSTGISRHFQLLTNGLLLHKLSDAVMKSIDELEISIYPGIQNVTDILAMAKEKTSRFAKKLTVNFFDNFRATFTSIGSDDENLVRKIYRSFRSGDPGDLGQGLVSCF